MPNLARFSRCRRIRPYGDYTAAGKLRDRFPCPPCTRHILNPQPCSGTRRHVHPLDLVNLIDAHLQRADGFPPRLRRAFSSLGMYCEEGPIAGTLLYSH